jgi:hypothetical protein
MQDPRGQTRDLALLLPGFLASLRCFARPGACNAPLLQLSNLLMHPLRRLRRYNRQPSIMWPG